MAGLGSLGAGDGVSVWVQRDRAYGFDPAQTTQYGYGRDGDEVVDRGFLLGAGAGVGA